MDNEVVIESRSFSEDHAVEKRLGMLHQAQKEMKAKKEMLRDSLLSDEEYIALEDTAKEARRRLTLHKQALLNEPESVRLKDDIKDLQIEVKDTRKLLGDELIGYFMKNKTLEFVSSKGQKVRFNVSANVSRKDQLSLFE